MRKNIYIFGLAFIVLLILCFGFYFLGKSSGQPSSTNNQIVSVSPESNKYSLLAKRIFIENPSDINVNFSNLRKELNRYFENKKLNGGNLYFEYLPTGTSIRISGDEQLVAASLMKVPVAMNAYKLAERSQVDLQKQLRLKSEWLDSSYGNLYKKGAGYTLTLEEAIEIMLEDSDNTALKAVASETEGYLPAGESALNYLDLDLTFNPDQSISIDSKSYSSFLKCLYFSCYNSFTSSQKILSYLANSSYSDRLASAVEGSGVQVAHKIGTNSDLNQSDCGIFYVPKRNYILCIMIPGAENIQTNSYFKEVSIIVYDYIKRLNN